MFEFLVSERAGQGVQVVYLLLSGLVLASLLIWLSTHSIRTAFWMTWIVSPVYFASGVLFAASLKDPLLLAITIFVAVLLLVIGLFAVANSAAVPAFDKTPWPKTWAGWILKKAGVLVLLVVLLATFNILGLMLFGMFAGTMFQSGKSVRRAQTLEIVSTLALCVRQNLPMPMALKTAALGQKRGIAATMERIAYWLVQGCPLGQALRKGWPQAPKDLLAAVEAGEKIGQLPRTLQTLMAELSEKAEDTKEEPPVDLTYPGVILAAASLIVLAMCVFIIPTFAEVLSDVSDGSRQLPLPTRILIDVSRFLSSRKGLPAALIVLVPAALYGVISILYRLLRRRRIGLRDWLWWHLPLKRGFERERCLRQLIDYLQAALRAGLDLPQSLYGAMALDLNQCYKNRIGRWAEQILAGQSPGPAAAKAGMGRTLAWAFSEPNQRNIPAVLAMIGETAENKSASRDNWIRSVSFPLIILLLGTTVGFILLAFFLPMVQLIMVYTGDIMLP